MPDLYLTAESVNKLLLAVTGQTLYRDTKLQGFGLRVGTRSKAYLAEKRVEGRTVRVTLGLHGQITAAQARMSAQDKLGQMAAGTDLNAQKKARAAQRLDAAAKETARAEHTLSKLCDAYVAWLKSNMRPSAPEAAN